MNRFIACRTRKHLAVAAVAVASSVAAGSAAAARGAPPEWEQCAHRDLPVAAGIGGILPVNVVPPPETEAALRGEIAVGTDCSIYELPV